MSAHPNHGKSISDILLSLKKVENINVSIRAEFFGLEWAASQSQARFSGKITGWGKKADQILKVMWEGWGRNKLNTLETLMGDDANGEGFDFRLEKNDDGTEVLFRAPAPVQAVAAAAARRRRGDSDEPALAADDGDSSDEETIEENLAELVEKLDKVSKTTYKWKRESPTAIKTDARKGAKDKPKLNAQTVNTKEISEIYEYLLPDKWYELQLKHTNALLHGDGVNAKISKGELIQWWGYCLALALNPGRPLEEMWSDKPKDDEILPPPSMGRHGMCYNRWKKIRSVLRFGPDDAASFAADPWCFVRSFVKNFNEHMADVVSPGWLLTVDESMCAWRGKQGLNDVSKIPKLSWVPRKPEPLGLEMKTAGDALSGMLLHVEMCEGAQTHAAQEFFDKQHQPHTTATTMRLVKEWFGTGRVVYGDSWFASVKTARALLDNGLYFVGDVKTNHSGFPKDELEAATGEERGAWAVYTTEIDGKTMYGVSHRRGPSVHEFIATCGTTLPGKAHVGKIEDDEDEHAQIQYELERKCPRILNDASEAQPCIDRHNRYRQFILALEKRILTDKFCVRMGTSMYGMLFTNCFFALRTFGNEQANFKHEMGKLALYMMRNPTRKAELDITGGPQKSPSPSLASRSNSPLVDDHANHILIPISSLIGYKGCPQPRCNMCNKGCGYVCLSCTPSPDRPFPIHPPSTKTRGKLYKYPCWATHLSAPESVPRGKKRKATRAGSPEVESEPEACSECDE